MKDIFSIYAMGEQIDINSATPIVLKFTLGIPESIGELVVKAREEKMFESLPDLFLRVPELVPFQSEIQNLIVFRSTIPYYTIESRAKAKAGGVTRGIKVVVKIDPREKERHKIIQWVDAIY